MLLKISEGKYSFTYNDMSYHINDKSEASAFMDGMRLYRIKSYFIDQMNQHILSIKRKERFVPSPLIVPDQYWIEEFSTKSFTVVNNDRRIVIEYSTIEKNKLLNKDYMDYQDSIILLTPEFKATMRTLIAMCKEYQLGHLVFN